MPPIDLEARRARLQAYIDAGQLEAGSIQSHRATERFLVFARPDLRVLLDALDAARGQVIGLDAALSAERARIATLEAALREIRQRALLDLMTFVGITSQSYVIAELEAIARRALEEALKQEADGAG